MAKKNMIERETKRIKLEKRYSEKRKEIKQAMKAADTFEIKLELQAKLQKLPLNSSKIRIRNRCWVTGRSRGYFRDFGISRHVLREMAHDCLLPGVTKSSW